ncbi:MAG TPA: ABC transporter permease [Herpetosiphonaceae bacterium]
MKRVLATMWCDLVVQWRNGLFAAAAVVVVGWALVLQYLQVMPQRLERLAWLLPPLLFNELVIVTFFFVGGLVLLEHGEGSLQAQIVSPLRTTEYLLSKVITLTLAALIQTVILVALLPGIPVHWPILLLGLTAMAVLFVLTGLIAVLRAPTLNAYLVSSVLYVAVLFVPLVPYIAGWSPWIIVLHPMNAPLMLLRAAIEPVPAWEILYGVVSSSAWIGVVFWSTLRAFRRFVILTG